MCASTEQINRDQLQRQVVDEIRQVIEQGEEGHVIALNAPTGFGKTKVILDLANELQDYTFVVFVRTRNELSTWVKNSLKFYGRLPSITLAKGLACTVMTSDTAESLPCHRCRLRREIRKSDYDRILELFRRLGTSDPYQVAFALKRNVDFCIYTIFKQLGEVSGSNIHVYTYPYLFRSRLHSILLRDLGAEGGEDVLDYVVAVCDEAHCLEKFFLMPDIRISGYMLKQVVAELDLITKKVKDRVVHEALKYAVKTVEVLSNLLVTYSKLDEESVIPGTHMIKQLSTIADLEDLYELFTHLRDIAQELFRESDIHEELALSRLCRFLASLREVDDRDVVLVWSQGGVEVRRTDLTRLYEECLSRYHMAILMSGTLPDEDYLVRVWGIPRRRLTYLDYSWFRQGDYKCIIVADLTSVLRTRAVMARQYARLIEKVYDIADKCVLAVFPCYTFMHMVYRELRQDYRNVTIVEHPDTRLGQVEERVKQMWRSGKRALVLAVADGKLVEGIELADDKGHSLISDVVLCGYPQPPPTQYLNLLLARITRDAHVGKEELVKTWTLQKVAQALGRAIRSEEDFARYWLADKRFLDTQVITKLRLDKAKIEILRVERSV